MVVTFRGMDCVLTCSAGFEELHWGCFLHGVGALVNLRALPPIIVGSCKRSGQEKGCTRQKVMVPSSL